jgi:spermidine synthase
VDRITRLRSYLTGVLVERHPSNISGELEVWIQQGRYVLHSTGANYSFDTLHRVFQQTFRNIQVKEKNPERVLVLGLGAGSIPSILYEELHLRPEITGIEADDAVIRLAKKYFNIQRFDKLSILHAKAEEFVSRCDEKFDLVISDVFVHTNVPEEASDKQYVSNLVRITAQNGTGLINFIIETPQQKVRFRQAEQFLRAMCDRVSIVHASEINAVLVWRS